MASVRGGKGREGAHEAIKEHAVGAALQMRDGEDVDLLAALAVDDRIGLSREQIDAVIATPLEFAGAASDQVRVIAERIEVITQQYPEAAGYGPGDIL